MNFLGGSLDLQPSLQKGHSTSNLLFGYFAIMEYKHIRIMSTFTLQRNLRPSFHVFKCANPVRSSAKLFLRVYIPKMMVKAISTRKTSRSSQGKTQMMEAAIS